MEVAVQHLQTILLFLPFVQTTTVNLRNSSLVHVPQDITPEVTTLYLDDNNILHLTDCCFCKYPLIERLQLRRNGLQTVSELAFANNTRLSTLELGYNRLISFPNFLYGAGSSLVEIDLRADMDMAVVTLTNLSFFNYPSLEMINLKYNRIISGILNLSNLTSLTTLNTYDCGLYVFPDLSAAPQLDNVQLRLNHFSSVPQQSIHGLTKLTHFALAETGISQLPNMQHLVALKKIYIHQNNLTTLHDLYDLPLTAVKLARNPLLCDKLLCWLRMWCFVKPVLAELDSTSVKCASPEHLQEAVFMTVHPVDMECYNGTAYICTRALLVKAKYVLS